MIRPSQHLMPTEKAGTLGVDLHAMFDLHQNGYLLKVKSGHDPMTGSVAFSLGKLSHRQVPERAYFELRLWMEVMILAGSNA